MQAMHHTLPLDYSGKTQRNRVRGEIHNLYHLEGMPYRCFVLDHGYFYTDDLYLVDSNGYELLENRDYQCTGLNKDAVLRSGKTVCAVIVITNPRVGSTVWVDAQMVGGEYRNVSPSIAEMAMGSLNNTRSVHWRNLINRPNKYTPNGHLHALWHLYGFESWLVQLERVVTAIMANSAKVYQGLTINFDSGMEALDTRLAGEQARLNRHLTDYQHTHRINSFQVGLNNVVNADLASETEARTIGNSVTHRYTTPLRSAQHIQSNFSGTLENHLINYNNPHKDNWYSVGGMGRPETLDRIGKLLKPDSTAEETVRLQEVTYTELLYYARRNLNADWVVSGRFAVERLGTGEGGADKVLTSDGWVPIADLVSAHLKKGNKVHYLSTRYDSTDQAVAAINSTFSDITAYPIGTVVIFKYLYTKTVGTANGSITTEVTVYGAAGRTGSGWMY